MKRGLPAAGALILVFFIALLCSGCGFHLRGQMQLPQWFNDLAIESQQAEKYFLNRLSTQLEESGIRVQAREKARYLLIISAIEVGQQISSVGASTNPRQYQLEFAVRYSIQSKQGRLIQDTQEVKLSQALTVNNDRILGSDHERVQVMQNMQNEAAIQMIYRMARLRR